MAAPPASNGRPGRPGRWRFLLVLAAVTAFCEIGPDAHAQTGKLDLDDALAQVLARLEGQPLGLTEALELAQRHATNVQAARAAWRAAAGEEQRTRGAFDPELFAEITATGDETPSSSPFSRPDVIQTEETVTSTGARILLPLGTTVEASVETRRLDTNSEFAAVDPEVRATGVLELRQPLLRGFGAGTSSEKTSAAHGTRAAAAAYDDAVQATRAEVERIYWSLYAGERDVAVQLLIVEQAEALLEQARLRAQAGMVGPSEVATARVFMAQQRIAVLDQEERLAQLSDQLASLMGVRPTAAERFRPTDEPSRTTEILPIETLLEQAYANNAALRQADRALQAAEARAGGAQRNRLPSLDLFGSLGGRGLAGTGRDVDFGGETVRVDVDGGRADALSQALGRDHGSWSVGLELSFPLMLRAGRGQRDRLRAEAERARHDTETIRRSVEERVRTSHRELTNSQRRLNLAEEGVAASLDQVRIGLIEYDNGRTTAFELSRLAADLAAAQQRLSDALVRAATAAADLRYLAAAPEPTTGATE